MRVLAARGTRYVIKNECGLLINKHKSTSGCPSEAENLKDVLFFESPEQAKEYASKFPDSRLTVCYFMYYISAN